MYRERALPGLVCLHALHCCTATVSKEERGISLKVLLHYETLLVVQHSGDSGVGENLYEEENFPVYTAPGPEVSTCYLCRLHSGPCIIRVQAKLAQKT